MKTAELRVRLTPEHLATIKAAARLDGLTVSAFVTAACLRAARAEGIKIVEQSSEPPAVSPGAY